MLTSSHHDLKEAISFSVWVYKLGEDVHEGNEDANSLGYGISPKLCRLTPAASDTSVSRGFPLQPTIYSCCFGDGTESLSCEAEEEPALSPIAYLLETQREAGFLVKYVDGTRCNPQTTMQYAIAANTITDRIYVVFRGTDELQDWACNLNSHSQKLDKGVCVHRGFYKLLKVHLKDLFGTIDSLLAQKQCTTYSVRVYGHSLGGALSSLFGYLLALHFRDINMPTKVHVISVAAPAVGNSAFRAECERLLNLTTVRLVHANDFAPACSFNDNTFHVSSTLVHLRRGRAKMYHDYKYPESLDSVSNCHSVVDHSYSNYWKAINQARVASDFAL
eukprot:gene15540-17766_t